MDLTDPLCNRTDICHSPHQTGEYGTRPTFRWLQATALRLDQPGDHKNPTGPVSVLLKKDTRQAPVDKPSPYKEG